MLCIRPPPNSAIRANEKVHVPLKSVHIQAKIRSFAADVTITQVFRNDENNPIEAVYCFPIEEQAAIYLFQASIDNRQIVAQLKEKKAAQQEYTDALQQGHGAYLLEQDEKSQDNFIINVGALPPSKECTITIAYVAELQYFQGSIIQFVVPTTIAPRYNPEKGGLSGPVGTTSKYVQTTPYTIDFRCHIDKMGQTTDEYIARINSPSHPIQVDFAQQDAYIVSFAQQNTHLDRDILINIELSAKRMNTITAVEPGAVMAVFTPTDEDCRQASTATESTNEFLFVIDCSGSMRDENKIGLARQAMSLFFKSLPLNSFFNIIRFGSQYKSLFPTITAIYNEENARQAEKLIDQIQADLGGTELMEPLQWVEQHSPGVGRARQIFLLTDGEISNVSEVLDLCRSMATSTRIFSFGLGRSPSRSLVKGLARSTNGRFVFIPPDSKVDVYVGEQLQKALQPSITNIDVRWDLGVEVETAPKKLPPVYSNDRLIVYALLNDRTHPFNHHSSVELRSETTNRSLGTAQVNRIPNVAQNETIARLAAKALILELQHEKDPTLPGKKQSVGSTQERFQAMNKKSNETTDLISNEEKRKKKMIELSLQYKILCPHTAFVGIEKRIDGNNAGMELREVPIEISADDRQLYPSQPTSTFFACNRLGSSIPTSYMSLAPTSLSTLCGSRGRGGATKMSRHAPQQRSQMESAMSVATSSSFRSAPESFYVGEFDFAAPRLAPMTPSSTLEPNASASITDDVWPSNDEDIVRHLINKQNFDGLWNSDSTMIEKLTGKSFSSFQSLNMEVDAKILTSLIVVATFERRFNTHLSLWYGVVQKARKRITTLLNNDTKNMESLLDVVRQQL